MYVIFPFSPFFSHCRSFQQYSHCCNTVPWLDSYAHFFCIYIYAFAILFPFCFQRFHCRIFAHPLLCFCSLCFLSFLLWSYATKVMVILSVSKFFFTYVFSIAVHDYAFGFSHSNCFMLAHCLSLSCSNFNCSRLFFLPYSYFMHTKVVQMSI